MYVEESLERGLLVYNLYFIIFSLYTDFHLRHSCHQLCYYKEYSNKKNVNYLYSFCKLIYHVKKFCLGLLAYPPVFFVY